VICKHGLFVFHTNIEGFSENKSKFFGKNIWRIEKLQLVLMNQSQRSMKQARATFTGKNSVGYEAGKTYSINIIYTKDFPVMVRGIGRTGWIPYESILSFLANWTNIQVIS
jgi:hypothetical protein